MPYNKTVSTGVQITTSQLAKYEWNSGLASKNKTHSPHIYDFLAPVRNAYETTSVATLRLQCKQTPLDFLLLLKFTDLRLCE
jgi:hypothetical protein